jgi:predicted ribosome quality control (RQC) complex YloA/Tae2 family protein
MESSEMPADGLRRLRKILARAMKRSRATLEKRRFELAETERAEWYRQIADSLLSASPSPRGATRITLFNLHTQKEEQVMLNPELDCRENAALFYKKARKGERGRAINIKKTAETEAEIKKGQRLLAEADAALAADATNADDRKAGDLCGAIAQLLKLPAPGGIAPGSGAAAVEKEKVPFRRVSIDGWDIYVGKNDAQNDELTTRFARPHDLWLHAAGHAGSHVLVRRPGRTVPVPPAIVKKAAALAAWFSKAKHASYAEVHFAEARFVRKRRHAPPGEVVLERYRSIRVTPCQPEDLFPSKFA